MCTVLRPVLRPISSSEYASSDLVVWPLPTELMGNEIETRNGVVGNLDFF
jgi:hypothetical protein